MAITTITASGDTSGATDRDAVRAAHTAGNDARLGNATYYFPPLSLPIASHAGRTLYLSDSTIIQGVYTSGDEGQTLRAALNTKDADGYRVLWDTDDPSVIDASTGPQIVANDIYHAYLGGDNGTINGARLLDAAFKCGQNRGINPTGMNLYCASARGTSTNTEYSSASNPNVRYPIAWQSDRLSGAGGTLTLSNITAGPFPGSGTLGGGPGIKVAGYDTVTIDGFRQIGELDGFNGYSLIVSENTGDVTIRDSMFLGGIAFTPEADKVSSYAGMIVDSMSFDNCLIGAGQPGRQGQVNLDLFRRIRCADISITNSTLSGFRRSVFDFTAVETGDFDGEMPANYLTSLYLRDVIIETFLTNSTAPEFGEPAVLTIADGASSIAGRVEMAGDVLRHGPNTDGMRWSDDATASSVLASASALAGGQTPYQRRTNYLRSIGMVAQWSPSRTYPRANGNTIGDEEGSTDLTVVGAS